MIKTQIDETQERYGYFLISSPLNHSNKLIAVSKKNYTSYGMGLEKCSYQRRGYIDLQEVHECYQDERKQGNLPFIMTNMSLFIDYGFSGIIFSLYGNLALKMKEEQDMEKEFTGKLFLTTLSPDWWSRRKLRKNFGLGSRSSWLSRAQMNPARQIFITELSEKPSKLELQTEMMTNGYNGEINKSGIKGDISVNEAGQLSLTPKLFLPFVLQRSPAVIARDRIRADTRDCKGFHHPHIEIYYHTHDIEHEIKELLKLKSQFLY